MKVRNNLIGLFAIALCSCAGLGRSCSSCNAEAFGSDWVVVQMDFDGRPYRCWELHATSIDNEAHSDGIYWKESAGGNLVHISGHYNRVQVTSGGWERAYRELGLTSETCKLIQQLRYDPTHRAFAGAAEGK